MAAVLTQSNSFKLTGMIGRRPNDGELYMAHFMGVGGAAKLISNAEDNPRASAARMFPNAAAANRSIFYDRAGRARSVSEVYSVLSARYAGAANSRATRTAMASVGDIQPSVALASAAPAAPPIDNAAYLSSFPSASQVTPVASVTPVTVASAAPAPAMSPPTDPMFRSLFQADGDRAQPVSPAVRALWGNSSLADLGRQREPAAGASAQCRRAATARPLQRPQRHVQLALSAFVARSEAKSGDFSLRKHPGFRCAPSGL